MVRKFTFKSNITQEYIRNGKATFKALFILYIFKKAVNPNAFKLEKSFISKEEQSWWARIKKIDYYQGIKADAGKVTDFDILRIAPMYVYNKINWKIRGSAKAIKDKDGNVIGYEHTEYVNFYIDLRSQGGVNQRYIRNLYNSFKFDNPETSYKITSKKSHGIMIETVKREVKNDKMHGENVDNFLNFQFNDFSDLIFEVCNVLTELREQGILKFHADLFTDICYKPCNRVLDRYIDKQAKNTSYNKKNAFSIDEKKTNDDDDDRTNGDGIADETETQSDDILSFSEYMLAFRIVEDREFLEQALKNIKSRKGKKQEEREKKVLYYLFSHGFNMNQTCEHFTTENSTLTPRTVYRYLRKFIKTAKKEVEKLKKA